MSHDSSQASVHCEVLENGLTALLCETHLAPVAEVQIWAKVGSADERPGEEGLAHFHEHMLFKGTERRGVGDVAAEVEGAGGRINAYTSLDVTCYHATLPSEELSLGLDVLSDAVLHSRFDPVEIEREIEVVLEEIRRSEDSPWHVLAEAVFSEAYRVHPYRAPILGTSESVSSIDRTRVRAFFERWYTPENLAVVVVGDFDTQALLGEVRGIFGALPRGGVTRQRAAEPAQSGMRSSALGRPFERANVELAWPSVSFSHDDAVYLDLLAYVLGGCETSRLVRRVKENERLADRIDASSYTPLDPGLSGASFETDADRVLGALEAVVREVERVRSERISEAELERARVNFLASQEFDRESVSGLAQKLGSFQISAGDWRREAHYLEAVRTATVDDLARVAREYLDPRRLTVGVVAPEAAASALDHARLAEAVERGIAETTRALAVPAALPTPTDPKRPAPRLANGAAGPYVHSFALPCGAALHVVPRPGVAVVAARAALLGGLLAETRETSGISQFTSAMWLRGTRNHSAVGFARAEEDIAAEVDSFSGRNSLGLTLETPTVGLERGLELFSEALLEPAFDPEEIERERADTLAAIERREDRLGQSAFRLFAETLFERHPYRQTVLGTAETVGGFGRETLRAHHEALIRARNTVLAVAGDVDPEDIAKRLSALLAPLPNGAFDPPSPAEEAPQREIRSAELHKDRAQAHVVIGFRGVSVYDADRFALEVISQLLAGQGGRLFLELRDKRSLAYSVSSINMEGVAPGWFAVYIATAPEKLDAARSGLLEELERLLQDGPDAAELDAARRHLIGNHAIGWQRDAAHAAQVALNGLYGLGADAELAYPEQIRAISRDDILRVAHRIIDLGAYTEAVIHP